MTGLSKSRLLQYIQCPKRLWLSINRPELAEEDGGVTARLSAGNVVGEVARVLYPEGVLIETSDAKQALADTAAALTGKRRPVFEAAFASSGVLVRADLLLPARGGYRLVEVKSSTKVKEYHLADAAIQSWVATQAGLAVKRVEIAHINGAFVYAGNGDYKGLFTHANITDEVNALNKEVRKWVKGAKTTLDGKEPKIDPDDKCDNPFPCPFLAYCEPAQDKNIFPLEFLPHKGGGKAIAAELRAKGYDDLRKVPGKLIDSAFLKRIWRVTKSGKPELAPEAGEALAALPFPRYYLDFETIDFAVPIWSGTRPYRQLPFQWSCHVERKNGTVEHKEFLAGDSSDPRRAFTETLIATLKTRGPVLVYNAGFESGRLKELAEDFPDLAKDIEAIRNRIVDLLPLARNHYYHRDLRGSWSLKAVLPTIAPELSYDNLEVANGGMAQEAYLELLHAETPVGRSAKLRNNLLAYCERDTWALVRLAHFFEGR